MFDRSSESQGSRFRHGTTLALTLSLCLAPPALATGDCRTIDGAGNNPQNPSWGSAGIQLLRIAPSAYTDGYATKSGADRPGPREVSNGVCAQSGSILNDRCASDFIWQWGQFLDHDIDLTDGGPDACNISTPVTDPFFLGTPIFFNRSIFDPATSVPGTPRQQLNVITSFIDGSNVYGSDNVRASTLRANDGTGRLLTSPGNLLPFNTFGLPNAQPGGSDPADFFVAGDVRANEQVGLTAMHTLFMREHNLWATLIHHAAPWLSDDEVYESARKIVGAEMQAITYNEFLPALFGRHHDLPRYHGYNVGVNPSIGNEFSTASYRFGHSALSPTLLRLDRHLNTIPEGNLPLRNGFFNPAVIINEGGIDPLLRGLAKQKHQNIDALVVDDVRNFLFGPPGAGGFDLASLNIQRGRDHGLPDYNTVRGAFGLAPKTTFAAITSDATTAANLAATYGSVDKIDPWLGGLAEDHLPGALVGELVHASLADQFRRLRAGDRFFYKRIFPGAMVRFIEAQTLSRIIRRNTGISRELQPDAFRTSCLGAMPAN